MIRVQVEPRSWNQDRRKKQRLYPLSHTAYEIEVFAQKFTSNQLHSLQ